MKWGEEATIVKGGCDMNVRCRTILVRFRTCFLNGHIVQVCQPVA